MTGIYKRFARRLSRTGVMAATVATLAFGFGTTAMPIGTASAEQSVINITASQHSRIVKISRAKPKTIRINQSFNEIVVGDPDIVTVSPLTDRSFYLVGLTPGTTGIALYGEDKQLVGSLDIEVGANTNQLNAELQASLPGSSVKATTTNGKVILKGKAKNPVAAAKAQEIAKKFDEAPINAVKVQGSQQVKLEVRFIEAQRSRGKELSISASARRNTGRTATNYNQEALRVTDPNTGLVNTILGDLISGAVPFGQFITSYFDGGTEVDIAIQALEERGLARRLAEPNLVALSGDTASFLAGGEFPIPVAQENNSITIEFKQFGVGLEFTPTVLDNGLINLKLAPEVSQVDFTNSVNFGNSGQIPAIVTRRAETTLELRDGQSFVLGGLLQKNTNNSKRQLPWLGDIPVLGALFRSTAYQRDETDLVIIVTPRLVKPLTPGEVPATPLDATAAPNDVDLFVNGDLEVNRAHLRKIAAAKEGVLRSGHVIELD